MKKIISVIMMVVIMALCSVTSFATVESNSTDVVYFDDGSYIEIVINVCDENFSTYATKTKTGNKVITYKNTDGELIFDATVTGTFTYTGSSSTCTASTISYNVYDDNWKMKEATASKSGNKAIGDVAAKRYTLGIPVQTVEQTITLTCSASGVLS